MTRIGANQAAPLLKATTRVLSSVGREVKPFRGANAILNMSKSIFADSRS